MWTITAKQGGRAGFALMLCALSLFFSAWSAAIRSMPKFEEIGAKAGVRFVHSTRKFTGKHKAEVLQMFTDGISTGGESYIREINGGNGYAGQSTTRLHVGIGRAQRVDSVTIRWPNGQVEHLPPSQVATLVNRFLYVGEGKGVVSK